MKLRKTQNRAQEFKKNHKGQRERYVITSKEEVFISHIYVPNYIASANKQTNKQTKQNQAVPTEIQGNMDGAFNDK